MRIVITGIGVVSGYGAGANTLMDGLVSGRRAIRDLSLFSLPGARSTLAAEVPSIDLDAVFGSEGAIGSSRTDAMAVVAAREALSQARLSGKQGSIDVALGGSTAGMFETEELLTKLEGDLDRAAGERLRTHPLSSTIDKLHAEVGPFRTTRSVCCACTSGAAAIALGAAWIRRGRSTIVLAGGADALCRLTYSGFGALSVLDRAPARPFARDRAGLTLGEGAALLVLETEASAKSRGAAIIAELAGYAIGSEAHHITNPEPGGKVAAVIIRRAIEGAHLSPGEVQYVNAHGTGTPQNDANEASAIRAVFGDHRVAVSSSKAQIGHTLAAAGAIEAAIGALAIARGTVPPTAGLVDPDPDCDLNHVSEARTAPGLDVVVSNSFGFGGTGASLVMTSAGRTAEPAPLPSFDVLITGVGAIVPRGLIGGAEVADLLEPRGGPAPVETVMAAPADPVAGLDAAATRRMDRGGKLSTAVIGRALADADARGERPVNRAEVCALSGTAFGTVDGSMRFMKRVLERGAGMASPADFPNLVPSSPVSHASIHWRLGGGAIATPDLSATGESAVATAIELIEGGVSASAVAGSVEEVSVLTERVLAPLLGIRSMTAGADGASALVIESRETARARGAKAIARIRLVASYRGEGSGPVSSALEELAIAPGVRDRVVSERAVDPARVLGKTGFGELPRWTLRESAGDHVGCGGVALAAAAAIVGRGDADRVLFVGAAPDRGYVFLLEREPA